jgi:hypothetical protein
MDHTSNDPVTNALMGCPPENYILIAYKRGCDDTHQKLQKRIKQLEAALRDVLLWGTHCEACDYDDDWEKIEVRARKALEGKDD